MTDFIVATSKKLDDPVMQEWAVNFYRDLPKNAHDERARIEAAWFHEFFIAQLLDRGVNSFTNPVISGITSGTFFKSQSTHRKKLAHMAAINNRFSVCGSSAGRLIAFI